MRGFLEFVWQKHRVIGLVTVAALCIALYFAADFAGEALYFANPANQNRPVEAWMSIRYVEQSWGLTKPVMFDIIGYDIETPPENVPRSVGEYLAQSNLSIAEFQSMIEEAQQMLQVTRGR
jgi:hypothetical protein